MIEHSKSAMFIVFLKHSYIQEHVAIITNKSFNKFMLLVCLLAALSVC